MTENEQRSLDRSNVQDLLSLTPMQAGMLFHYLNNSENKHYFEQLSMDISGKINLEFIEQAWNHVVDTNEMLRTIYRWDKLAEPIQIILKNYQVPIKRYDLSGLKEARKNIKIEEIKEIEREKIDLTSQPFRISLILSGDNNITMLITYHHILYDGWSNGIILKEFFQAYNTIYNGGQLEKPKKHPFKQFVTAINSQNEDQLKKYWANYLGGFETRTPLPPIEEGQVGGVEHYHYNLDKRLTGAIKGFTRKNRITMAALLYSIWGIILQRYNNTDDIIFGTTVSGRNGDLPGIEEMVGLFINTIPLRVKGDGKKSILELLKEVDMVLKERTRYEHVPLVDINSYSGLGNEEELFNSIMVIENYPLDRQFDDESLLQVDSYSISESTNYDLTLAVEIDEIISIQFIYDSSKFNKDMIQRTAAHFHNVLVNILENPTTNAAQLEMLTEKERKQILVHFNNIEKEESDNRTIVKMFEEKVDKFPDKTALIYHDRELTYQQLNHRANKLARRLREKGIQRNELVGIMIDRSMEMLVGIMGIIKAGAAYLPIAPDSPLKRTDYTLKDSGAKLLLTDCHLREQLPKGFKGDILYLDRADTYHQDGTNLELINQPEDLAYSIYTSGTTGKPKGTLISHANLLNLVMNKDILPIDEKDRLIQVLNYIFDVSVLEIFVSLLNGSSLMIIDKEVMQDVEQLSSLFKENEITQVILSTAILNLLIETGQDEINDFLGQAKKIYFGGERASRVHLQRAFDQLGPGRLVNIYGPTECTIFATSYTVWDKEDITYDVPIGKPIPNAKVHILSKYNQLQPIGAWGELTISGKGVGQGYLNKPELTAEKFTVNPITGEMMYKTGDLARWLPDGNIAYGGRMDQQVKIRGFRIEIGDIESTLLNHNGIKEAAIVTVKHKGDKYLVAYYTVVTDKKIDQVSEEDLKIYLQQNLPDYMVPPYFIETDGLPINQNGKIDRKALSSIDLDQLKKVNYIEPETETEKRLASIWSQLLGIESIGLNDNFFDLGGHSLKATILVSKIHKEFEIKLSLEQIFDRPTIKGLAQYINNVDKSLYQGIKKVDSQEYYSTSSAQKRMYMLQQLEPESTSYNLPGAIEITGNLDIKRLNQVLDKLIQRHESFRTTFEIVEDELVQKIGENISFQLEIYQGEDVKQIIKDFIRPFDLDKGPLFRAGLVTLDDDHLFLIDMHHIIADGVSAKIFIDEFIKLYAGQELSPLRIQYKDFSHWQNQLFTSKEMAEEREFWLDTFSDRVPVLNLPTDYPRGKDTDFSGDTYRFDIGADIFRGLESLKGETGTTLYMILLAAYNIFLARYSGEDDIVVGTPVACREHPDLEQIIGMFVNTLPIRNQLQMEGTFKDFLGEVKNNTIQAFQNQNYPFDMLVKELDINRNQRRNPLFDTMFSLQEDFNSRVEIPQLSLDILELDNKNSKFNLTLDAYKIDNGLYFSFEYSTHLFQEETIQRMAEHFRNILDWIVTNPEKPLREIEILSHREKKLILEEFNSKKLDSPGKRTFIQVFEENIDNWKDKIAVSYYHQELTYGELNQKANQLARQLRERGVDREKIVGLMMDRSLEMIIGILGILKAGGAYLPLDPNYPQNRLEYMLADSDAQLLLVGESCLQKGAQVYSEEIVVLNDELLQGDKTNLPMVNQPEDMVYLIYTSGSTGRPKGVMVEHQSLMNTAFAWRQEFKLDQMEISLLQMASFSFDVFADDMIRSLLNGGKMVICPDNYRLDFEQLYQLICQEEINIFNSTPALVIPFMDYIYDNQLAIESVELLILGSDSCRVEDFKRIMARFGDKMRIINIYGLTETTIDTSYYEEEYEQIIDGGNVPIGQPLPNGKVYVLDDSLKPQPIGVVGQLYVGGKSLARGYYNRKELTKERFIESPFKPGERLYKTGDQARWLADGNLEFLGRIDYQTKIRGYRIELGEIENLLLEKEEIKNVCLVAKNGGDGNKYLAGYYTKNQEISVEEIRDYLKERLPDYMVPTYLIPLEEMPLTPNDKIDRNALPQPDTELLGNSQYQAAENKTEAQLISIFKDILNLDKVGVNDDFFELGGHSLKATIMVGRVMKELGVKIPLRQIFETSTVKGLSRYIQKQAGTIYNKIEKVEKREYYPLSSAQHQIYIVSQMEQESLNYNMPGVLVVEGKLDRERVEEAVQQLLDRHSSLRTYFKLIDGSPVQVIVDQLKLEVDYQVYSDDKSIDWMVEQFIRPFNLNTPPLFRVQLVDWGTQQVLLFDLHHIIADGVSTDILFKDFHHLYAGDELAESALEYKDYAVWEQRWIESGELEEEARFWHQQFDDTIPKLDLPTAYERPGVIDYQGKTYCFEVDEKLTRDLTQLAVGEEATLFMVLLSGYQVLLSKWSGQEDIVVGSTIAGRPHPDLERLMGVFVNTLPFRNQPVKEKSFTEYLSEVKENALQVFENQTYPFERLIDDLDLDWDLSRNPIYDVVFVLQNVGDYQFELDGIRLKPYSMDIGIAKYDLTLRAFEMEDKLNFEIEYRTALFKEETIKELAQDYINLLKSIVKEPTNLIKEIEPFATEELEMLDGEEFAELDFDF